MNYKQIIIAGQDVADKITILRSQVLPSKTRPGCFDSEALSKFQQNLSQFGYIEAEIVDSMYGFSVRYASGLQNFGPIYSSRAKQVDGTLECAIEAAKKWQEAYPTHRWVTRIIGE